MSADEVSIEATDVTVRYSSAPEARGLAAALLPARRVSIDALRGVSVTIHRGEAVAVVGANGSGKSTLLQVMAGLQRPTRGSVRCVGRPVLLGASGGMDPRVSGRRNIYLGGALMGFTREEVDERMDEITSFADIGEFIDLPMRTYSRGMAARVRFAIGSTFIRDVLLIDEMLGAGDEEFQGKSRQRMQDVIADAGTVVLVSHSMMSLRDTCTRAIWVHDGRIEADGATSEVICEYVAFAKHRGDGSR